MLKLNLNKAALLSLALAAHASAAGSSGAARVRWTMGTLCEIDAPGAPDAAVNAAFAEIERWDRILSLYKADSELSDLNRSAGQGPVRVSADLYNAVAAALALAAETGGAFDPTILPVLRGGPERLPLVGWSKVVLDPGARTIELPAGTGLDSGGFGKGWALDMAAGVLKAGGAARARLNFGGQILAMGRWTVVLPGRAEPLELTDASIATSGDDEKPGHIKSPFDGLPVRHAGSASAVMPAAVAADAWSTALFVLGRAPSSFAGRSFFAPVIPAAPIKGGRS